MTEARDYRGRHQIVIPRRELAIDFANTVAYRGGNAEDSLRNFSDLVAWLSSAKALPQTMADAVPQLFAAAQINEAWVWAEAVALREAIYRLLHLTAIGLPAAADDLKRLNRALAEAPARSNLAYGKAEIGWAIELRPAVAAMLAPVLWSAADLLAGQDSARVRECANPQCLWLFLDDSKNGTRRWCSMQSCGNRAKAHRHYQRRKQRIE